MNCDLWEGGGLSADKGCFLCLKKWEGLNRREGAK